MAIETTKFSAKMLLPAGAKKLWSAIMRGEELPSAYDRLETGEPIVMAYAAFAEGTQVIGGVCKGRTRDANSIFMWVLDRNGMRYPGWPIDLGDAEDFSVRSLLFAVDADAEQPDYTLEIAEHPEGAPAAAAPSEPPAAAPEPAKKKPAKAKSAAKQSTKQPAKKSAKKPAKKPAKKATKKSAKKPAKKPAKKATKKSAKSAKKPAGKSAKKPATKKSAKKPATKKPASKAAARKPK